MTVNTDRKRGRDQLGRFGPGNSGKPRGAHHKATLAVEKLLDGEGEALAGKAVDLALSGDFAALRLCMERILLLLCHKFL